jgi:magnesium transporter
MDGLIHRHTKPGTAPGTLTGRAPVADEALDFTLVEYTADSCEVKQGVSVDECRAYLGTTDRTWIDVSGRASSEMLQNLGKAFHLHPLALEDVFHASQKSKLELYDHQGFLVMNDPAYEGGVLRSRQVSIFFGADYVISFHDHKADIFRPVRERLQTAGSRLRLAAIDYLVYALVDLIVDRKFPTIEGMASHLEELEEEALGHPTRGTLANIHQARRDLSLFHRIQWAEREAVLAMMRPETPFITIETRTYLRDCFDHAIAVLDLVESYREICSGLMEVYLMHASNRLAEIMKTMAIITLFFTPLTFLAGVYGMNFERDVGNMPELGWKYGYLFFWCLAATIVVGVFVWIRSRKWL